MEGSNQAYALLSNSFQVFFDASKPGYEFVKGRPSWKPYKQRGFGVKEANKNLVSNVFYVFIGSSRRILKFKVVIDVCNVV